MPVFVSQAPGTSVRDPNHVNDCATSVLLSAMDLQSSRQIATIGFWKIFAAGS